MLKLRSLRLLWLLSLLVTVECRTTTAAKVAVAETTAKNVRTALDVGIYWYGPDQSNQKALPNTPNPYFDPLKKTMIYMAGWKNMAQTNGTARDDAIFVNDAGETVYMFEPWLKAGWNVGVFFWDQLADEPDGLDAEGKIWGPTGPKGMRWRDENGIFHENDPNAPKVGVGELAFQSYRSALADYRGPNIRLVGWSLGTQLAAVLAGKINTAVLNNELPKTLMPSRVALLDGFWSKGNPVVASPGAKVREIVIATQQDVAWEHVVTSRVRSYPLVSAYLGDVKNGLTDLIGEVVFRPNYVSKNWSVRRWLNPVEYLTHQHYAAPRIYLGSLGLAAASCCGKGGCVEPPLAGMSDDGVKRFAALGKSCVQKRPMNSVDDIEAIPSDLLEEAYRDADAAAADDSGNTDAADSPDASHDAAAPAESDGRGEAGRGQDARGR